MLSESTMIEVYIGGIIIHLGWGKGEVSESFPEKAVIEQSLKRYMKVNLVIGRKGYYEGV